MYVKSCGKAHAWCRVCKPDRHTPRGYTKQGGYRHPLGVMGGANNPNWRGGITGLGYGPGWKAARRVVWERDKVCCSCGTLPVLNRKLDVHHVVERRKGGSNDLDNLVALHHECHMKVHAGKAMISKNYASNHSAKAQVQSDEVERLARSESGREDIS